MRRLGNPLVFFVKGAVADMIRPFVPSVAVDPAAGYVGWVYAAVSKRARRIGAIGLHLYRLQGGDLKEVDDHELLALLDQVNPVQDSYQFFYTLELFLCLWGQAPILKDRQGTNRVMALWPLRPDLLQAEKATDGRITGYVYRAGATSARYAVEDVIMVREPSPKSLYDGYSPVTAAALEIDTDLAAALWNKHLLENFAEPGVVLSTDKKLEEKDAKRVIQAWKKRTGGPRNAGAVTILDKGLTATAMGRSPDELQLSEMRKLNREAIVSVLGVPVSLLTSAEVTFSNMETAERIFAQDTLDPQARLITGALNGFLVPEADEMAWIDFDTYVPENMDQKIKLADSGDGKYLTVNEQREIFDREPLEGGDFIFKPLGVMPQVGAGLDPTAEDPAAPPASGQAGFARLPVRVQKRGWKSKRMGQIKRHILARTFLKRKALDGMADRVAAKIAEAAGGRKGEPVRVTIKGARAVTARVTVKSDKPPHDQRIQNERMEYLAKLPRAKTAMKRDVKKYFGTQRDEVLGNLDKYGLPKGAEQLVGKLVKGQHGEPHAWNAEVPAELKANTGTWLIKVLFDKAHADELMAKLTVKHAQSNIKAGSEAIQKLTGVTTPGGGVLGTPFVHDFIAKRSFLMTDVNELTRQKLSDSLREGIDAGEDLGSIRERISSIYDEAEGFRAETIARTEVGTAQQFGRNEEMRQQGVQRKVWVAIFSNTREDHEEADGQVVNVNDSFDVGSEHLAYPGDPAGSPENVINCQCSASPTLEDLNP